LRCSFNQKEQNMRIQTLAGIAVLAALAFPVSAMADETGMVGGAIAGAVVGGPVGAVVGGVVGNSMTDHHYHHRYYAQRRPYYRD
jgi:outer membrane lipoprotein SlyB